MSHRSWYEIRAKAADEAEIWIYEQIGHDFWGDGLSAAEFAKDLAALDVKHIALHINSPGGAAFDGQAIYTCLCNHPATIITYVDGLAASIASVIALAGDTVVMAENALFMIHNPYGVATGDATVMRKMAETLDKLSSTISGVYEARTGRDPAEIIAAMAEETWYTAVEAKAFGFADEIAGPLKAAACATFDFAALGFRRVPTTLATPQAPTSDPPDPAAEAPPVPAAEATPLPGRPLVPAHLYRKDQT